MRPKCRKCGVVLNDDNWHPSKQKRNRYICKMCDAKYMHDWYLRNRDLTIARAKQWQSENPDKANEKNTRSRRRHGALSMANNKSCALYLGVHIAERVLEHVFKDVTRMPLHNPGYDFICNRDKLVDIKASTQQRDTSTMSWRWKFTINHNMIADYFLCIAFDDREHLNPLHLWLLPANEFNQMQAISISQSTLSKWSQYEQSIENLIGCCDELRIVAADQE